MLGPIAECIADVLPQRRVTMQRLLDKKQMLKQRRQFARDGFPIGSELGHGLELFIAVEAECEPGLDGVSPHPDQRSNALQTIEVRFQRAAYFDFEMLQVIPANAVLE